MILTEYSPISYNRSTITEALAQHQPIVLKNVVLQRADAENQNGRTYPFAILKREADKYQVFIKERRALGELDHPSDPVVNLKNASHNIVKMWFVGKDLLGDIEVLSTPSGNILKELLKNDIKLGISSRGLGSVTELGEGKVEVQDDFSLVCFDCVSQPSTIGAYLTEARMPSDPWRRIDGLIHDFLNEMR